MVVFITQKINTKKEDVANRMNQNTDRLIYGKNQLPTYNCNRAKLQLPLKSNQSFVSIADICYNIFWFEFQHYRKCYKKLKD